MPPRIKKGTGDGGALKAGVRSLRADMRRERVAQMLVRGLTQREMAVALDCAIRTIRYDIEAIREEGRLEVAQQTVADVGAEVRRSTQQRVRDLWLIVERSKGRTEKVPGATPGAPDTIRIVDEDRTAWLNALREIRATEEAMVRALQSLGIVYKAPVAITLEAKFATVLGTMADEDVVRLATLPPEAFRAEVTRLIAITGAEAPVFDGPVPQAEPVRSTVVAAAEVNDDADVDGEGDHDADAGDTEGDPEADADDD